MKKNSISCELLHPGLETVEPDGREAVVPDGLLVVGRVVQAPLGGWHFLGERHGVAMVATEASVLRHGTLDVFHHDLIVVGQEVVVHTARGFGWKLVVPVDGFVVGSSGLVGLPVEPVWMPGGGSPGMPVRVRITPFSPAVPCIIWMAAVVCFYFIIYWLPLFW